MTDPASTALLPAFREQFPEFSPANYTDEVVVEWLGVARDIHSLSSRATLYHAAHLLTLDQAEPSTEVKDNAGVLTSEGVGPKRATYLTQAESERDVFFARTKYGQIFLTLERRATAFSARVYG